MRASSSQKRDQEFATPGIGESIKLLVIGLGTNLQYTFLQLDAKTWKNIMNNIQQSKRLVNIGTQHQQSLGMLIQHLL